MNSELERLVFLSDLRDEKRRLEYYRNKIFDNNCKMSRLTFDRSVGLYALNYDRYLNSLYNDYEDEIDQIDFDIMRTLERLDGVKEYIKLRGENQHLKHLIEDYFRKVNIDFRQNYFEGLKLPNIYVKSSEGFTHIIDSNDNIEGRRDSETLIYPLYDISSKRDLRHFYNKLSFHYLESLVDDLDYSLENKKLGKILIK